MMSDTQSISVVSYPTSLAVNPNRDRVIVVGRCLFRVFAFDNKKGFIERLNLSSDNWTENYLDVAWNPINHNSLVTSGYHGEINLWDFNRPKPQVKSILHHFGSAVHRVTFHRNDPNLLMLGGQDGSVVCFDLRKKEPNQSFCRSESVRDIQINPHNYNIFATTTQYGLVQIWDMRNPNEPLKNLYGHTEPVYSCDWHSEMPFLATSGLDKSIKVWDTENNFQSKYTIYTTYPVLRIKWQPHQSYRLVSCATTGPAVFNLWDVRGNNIPCTWTSYCKGFATNFAWVDHDRFLSTNADRKLYRNSFKTISENDFPSQVNSQQDYKYNLAFYESVLKELNVSKTPKESMSETLTTPSEEKQTIGCCINWFYSITFSQCSKQKSFVVFFNDNNMKEKFMKICGEAPRLAAKASESKVNVWNFLITKLKNMFCLENKENGISDSSKNISKHTELGQYYKAGSQLKNEILVDSANYVGKPLALLCNEHVNYRRPVDSKEGVVDELNDLYFQLINLEKLVPILNFTPPSKLEFDHWSEDVSQVQPGQRGWSWHLSVCFLIVLPDELRNDLGLPNIVDFVTNEEVLNCVRGCLLPISHSVKAYNDC